MTSPNTSDTRPWSMGQGAQHGSPDESTPIFRSPRNFGGTYLTTHAENSPELAPDERPPVRSIQISDSDLLHPDDAESHGSDRGEADDTTADVIDRAREHALRALSEADGGASGHRASVQSHTSGVATGAGSGREGAAGGVEQQPAQRRSSRRATGSGTVIRRANGSARARQPSGAPTEASADGDAAEPHASAWRKLVDKYGSVELDNKGSVARDHLALERTFLAWMRTSLSFASIGIAITQLFRLNTTLNSPASDEQQQAGAKLRQMGKPLGATFLGIAIIVLLAGWRRYFEAQHWIIRGKFPASRGSILLVTIMSIALIVTSLVVVVLVNPTSLSNG